MTADSDFSCTPKSERRSLNSVIETDGAQPSNNRNQRSLSPADPCPTVGAQLDLARKLHQGALAQDVTVLSKGGRLERPSVVELDPTSFCDLACPECISGALLNRTGFSETELLNIGHDIISLGVRAVVLIGGGEPLVHPATPKLIRLLGEHGVAVGVTTNGTLIDRCTDILAEFATWTRVSVDAASAQSYARFRPSRSGRNMFHTVIQNMRSLAHTKRGTLGYSYLLIVRHDVQGRISDHNFDEVLPAARLAKEIGCDYFELKPCYNMDHYLISFAVELHQLVTGQLAKISAMEDDRFKIIAPRTLGTALGGDSVIEEKTYHRCPIAELRTLVTSAGAYICPYHRGNQLKNYGDPKTTSLRDMWNGPLRETVMATTDPSRDCRFHCIRHSSNQELVRIRNHGTSGSSHEGHEFDPFI